MTEPTLFPFADYWWLYGAFAAFVGVLLFLDLGVFHRQEHPVTFREAGMWTAVWVVLAMAFDVGLYFEGDENDWRGNNDDDFTIVSVAIEFLIGWYF